MFDEFACGLDALLEEADPEQILIITQATAAILDIRLLHVHSASILCVALSLVLDALSDVFALKAFDASVDESLAELLEQFCVADNESCFEQGRFGKHVGIRLFDGFVDGPRGVADFESEVPKGVKDEFDDGAELRFDDGLWSIMEEHDINVGEGVEFGAAVSADGAESEAELVSDDGNTDLGSGSQEVLEDDVEDGCALVAHIHAGAAFFVEGVQTLVLSGEEGLVNGEEAVFVESVVLEELFFCFSEDGVSETWH